MVRCMKPLKTALPSWSNSTCERSTPVRCWRVPGFSMSYPTTVAGSISWTRRSTGSPSTGVQLPQLCSLSAALWSKGRDAATGWLALSSKQASLIKQLACILLLIVVPLVRHSQGLVKQCQHSRQRHKATLPSGRRSITLCQWDCMKSQKIIVTRGGSPWWSYIDSTGHNKNSYYFLGAFTIPFFS